MAQAGTMRWIKASMWRFTATAAAAYSALVVIVLLLVGYIIFSGWNVVIMCMKRSVFFKLLPPCGSGHMSTRTSIPVIVDVPGKSKLRLSVSVRVARQSLVREPLNGVSAGHHSLNDRVVMLNHARVGSNLGDKV